MKTIIDFISILNWKGLMLLFCVLFLILLSLWRGCSYVIRETYKDINTEIDIDTIDDYQLLCVPITGKHCEK